jgi:hypothetical protein
MSTLSPLIVASPNSDELLAAWTSGPQRAVFGDEIGGAWPPELARHYTSTRLGIGPWEAPLTVFPTNVSAAAIALDDRGDATAAWISRQSVEASEYTP